MKTLFVCIAATWILPAWAGDGGKSSNEAPPPKSAPKSHARSDKKPAAKPGPEDDLAPAARKAFLEGMKDYAETLRKQLADFGAKLAADIQKRITPELKAALKKALEQAKTGKESPPARAPAPGEKSGK